MAASQGKTCRVIVISCHVGIGAARPFGDAARKFSTVKRFLLCYFTKETKPGSSWLRKGWFVVTMAMPTLLRVFHVLRGVG
jgi:hypothetical protein